MTPAAATLIQPTPLDVLQADLAAIDTAIVALRLRAVEAGEHLAFELRRYIDAAVERRAEVEAEIAAANGARSC